MSNETENIGEPSSEPFEKKQKGNLKIYVGMSAGVGKTYRMLQEARHAMADFLGCDADEVAFGMNMTSLTFAMSRAIGRELKAGDEILLTALDHDANFSPWKALEELNNENHPLINKLKLKLTGRVAPSVIESIKEHGLETFLSVTPFQPHDQAIRQMKSAAVLLLCVYEDNKFIVTGKLFEYLAAHRPILFTGSKDGDAARIVLETEAGPVFSRDEVQPIKQHILFLYQQFEKGELQLKSDQHQKCWPVAGRMDLSFR